MVRRAPTFHYKTTGRCRSALDPLVAGSISSLATAISDDNDVVGFSRGLTGKSEAVVWSHGGPTPTALGQIDPSDGNASALAVNNVDVIVGGITNSTLFPQFGPVGLAVTWENNLR